jgi:hypothetical protein
MGINMDVIVLENPAMPPEPLFMGSTAEMARSFPSIRVRGNGVASLTRAAEDGDVPAVGLYLNHLFPGDLTALSESKQVLGEAEHALLASERLASLAWLLSAPYPHDTLDHAWRQLVFWSSLDRFTRPEGANAYLDMLAGLREVFVSAETVGETARAALVAQVDTDRRGVALPQDAVPLVVFNPSSWARTDVCTVELPESYEAFALQDQVGDEVAFHVQDSPGLSGGPVLRFVAVGVPGLGQRTYYLVPGAVPPAPVVTSDPLLENDRFLVELDPRTGDIARFVDKRSGANYAGGALNRVLALGQDRSRRNDGRDFWTNGRLREVEGPPTRVTRTLYDKAQKLEVASRFAGGRVTRTLWAYDGVDRVDARIVLDGVSAADDLIGLTFAAPEPGAAVVFGERFGRTVGARNGDALVLRTKPLENVAGTATYAAHGFASMSPGDHLRVGMDRVLTLGPSVVVHGDGLASAATQVQRAFVAREMASQVVSHRDAAAQPLWSDRTFTVSHRKAGDVPSSLRILVGGPEDNTVTAEFLATLPDSAVTLFYERLSSGVALLVAPETGGGEYPNATLLIGGATADQSALLARDLTEALETRGSYNIAPSQYIAGAGRVDVLTPAPETGLGILYAGTRMATADPDGGILIGLHEDSDRAGTYRPRKASFDYALFPHDTSWREARLNREAGALAEPLQATRGAIHRGPLPGSGKLLSYNSEGFLLSSLRPVGEVATLSGAPGMPRNGLVAWGFDGRALPSRLAVSGLGGVQRASRADWAGSPQVPLRESGDNWEADFAAGVIQPVWLLTNTGNLRTNPPGDVSGASAEASAVPLSTTYWREGRGVAPPGGIPLALQLEGTLGPDTSAITLVAANLQNTGRLEGTIALEAAEGMSIGPVTVPYVLGPGEVLRESIAILQTGPSTAEMAVAAQGRVNGRDYRAVLSASMQPLDVEVDYTEAQLRVRLRNASGLAATGMVDLIVPPAFWPERVGVWGRMEEADALVTPASRGVNVPAYGVQTLYFRVGGASADARALPWAVARVAANGQVQYIPFEGLGTLTVPPPQNTITPPGPRARPSR